MGNHKSFRAAFQAWFRPIFLWGYGSLIVVLSACSSMTVIHTVCGPSLLTSLPPASVLVANIWPVGAVGLTLAVLALIGTPSGLRLRRVGA